MKKTHFKNIYLLFISGLLFFFSANGIYAQEGFKEILSIEAYDQLQTMPDTFLIDVRTRAEYQFTGHFDRAYLFPLYFMTGKLAKGDDGYEYQYDEENTDFIKEISKFFDKKDNLLIICRDGKRSALAAKKLVDNGFENVFNVKDGFEGKKFPHFENSDDDKFYNKLAKQNEVAGRGHRRHSGWQWWGLPWTYDMDLRYLYPPDRPKNISEQ